MKTIWVLDNSLKLDPYSLHELEILCLIASVSNWKSLYPENERFLYCDTSVHQYLESIGILDLWDRIDTEKLSVPDNLNRRPFWAASKIKVLKDIQAPFIIMDCDLYFKNNSLDLKELEKYDLVTSHLEETSGIYPGRLDPYSKYGLDDSGLNFIWNTTHAFNVCFFYIGNEKLRNDYFNLSFRAMEKLSTKFGDDPHLNGNQMIFWEQKILKEFSDLYESKTSLLSKYFIKRREWERELPNGYETLNMDDSYFHLDTIKRFARIDQNLFLDNKSKILNSILENSGADFCKRIFESIKISNQIFNSNPW
jgi:hypothetical protein